MLKKSTFNLFLFFFLFISKAALAELYGPSTVCPGTTHSFYAGGCTGTTYYWAISGTAIKVKPASGTHFYLATTQSLNIPRPAKL